jgi:hypothetical protein
MNRIVVVVAIAACGSEPPARSPEQRADDSAGAVTALQAARFAEAERTATTALELDPRNPRAAAVRAIARYQAAGEQLYAELEATVRKGDKLGFLDHAKGRGAWTSFGDALDAIDRDLAIAGADPKFSLELCLACWEHDWNHNGRIDDRDRMVFEIEFDGHGGTLPDGDPRRRPTFRFDVGDVEWARAMVAFQHAAIELVLAYRWTELDKLFAFSHDDPRVVIHLDDAGRVRHARSLVLAGLDHADRSRADYLAETDDDREWVPNPRQNNHPMPLEVDDQLFETWAGVTGDVRRLLDSKAGISLRDAAGLVDRKLAFVMPDAYVDVGAMFEHPSDIVIDTHERGHAADSVERVLHGLLGHGYRDHMTASPIVGRLKRMAGELDRGEDTFERKLHYLFWLN